jgi:signal peptidase II
MRKFLCLSSVLGLVILALDQVTKVIVEQRFYLGESIPVLPFFSLTYVRNQGAAWGMLQGAHYFLAGFAVVALVVIGVFWRRLFGNDRRFLPLVGVLFAGIIGNLIDRVRLGYVVDFLDFHWGSYHFPCFNVADSAICLSVFGIILLQWWTKEA